MERSVNQLLEAKGRDVWTVGLNDTVFVALERMSKHNVGALVVMEKDQIRGIFSERDYARKVILEERCSKDTKVREIMTKDVLVLSPEASTAEAMELMSKGHARHLPVVKGGHLVGLISIGDVVSAQISDQANLIEQLESYIAPGYY